MGVERDFKVGEVVEFVKYADESLREEYGYIYYNIYFNLGDFHKVSKVNDKYIMVEVKSNRGLQFIWMPAKCFEHTVVCVEKEPPVRYTLRDEIEKIILRYNGIIKTEEEGMFFDSLGAIESMRVIGNYQGVVSDLSFLLEKCDE